VIKGLLVEGDPLARVQSVTISLFVWSERRSQHGRWNDVFYNLPRAECCI